MLKQCQNREEWDENVLDKSGHPLQLWGWGEVKSTHGWATDRLMYIDEDDNVLAMAQVLIRKLPWPLKSLAYVPRGPIDNDGVREKFLDELSEYIKKTYHSVALSIEPDDEIYRAPFSWVKSKNRILPSDTVILDLEKSDDKLQADMSKKTRQYIRKSTKDITSIKKITKKDDLAKCLEIYHDTNKRAGFDVHDDDYYYDIFDKLSENSQVFAAYLDNQPVAFLWLAISAATSFELYGGMNEDGQKLRANYALKWYAISKCKEWGISRYDFGGLIDGGVATFKMGWTDHATKLAGTYDKPLSPLYFIWNNFFQSAKVVVRKIKKIIKK